MLIDYLSGLFKKKPDHSSVEENDYLQDLPDYSSAEENEYLQDLPVKYNDGYGESTDRRRAEREDYAGNEYLQELPDHTETKEGQSVTAKGGYDLKREGDNLYLSRQPIEYDMGADAANQELGELSGRMKDIADANKPRWQSAGRPISALTDKEVPTSEEAVGTGTKRGLLMASLPAYALAAFARGAIPRAVEKSVGDAYTKTFMGKEYVSPIDEAMMASGKNIPGIGPEVIGTGAQLTGATVPIRLAFRAANEIMGAMGLSPDLVLRTGSAIEQIAGHIVRGGTAGAIYGGVTRGTPEAMTEDAAFFAGIEGALGATGIALNKFVDSNWFRSLTIKERGLVVQNIDDMIARGYPIDDLMARGYSPDDLIKKGFTIDQIFNKQPEGAAAAFAKARGIQWPAEKPIISKPSIGPSLRKDKKAFEEAVEKSRDLGGGATYEEGGGLEPGGRPSPITPKPKSPLPGGGSGASMDQTDPKIIAKPFYDAFKAEAEAGTDIQTLISGKNNIISKFPHLEDDLNKIIIDAQAAKPMTTGAKPVMPQVSDVAAPDDPTTAIEGEGIPVYDPEGQAGPIETVEATEYAEEAETKERHLMGKDEFIQNAKNRIGNKFYPEGSAFGTESQFVVSAEIAHREFIKQALVSKKITPKEASDLHKKDYPDIETWPEFKELGREPDQNVLPETTVTSSVESAQTVPGQEPVEEAKPETKGQILYVPIESLVVAPEKFQWRRNLGKGGVDSSLKHIKTWNPDLAGVVAVWQDPSDGKTYVINGHHRYERAVALGVKNLNVRYIDAPDAKTAKMTGALINIAEGSGSPVDAAIALKESGKTGKQLEEEYGISLKRSLAQKGFALSKLDRGIISGIQNGEIPEEWGVIVGNSIEGSNTQWLAIKALLKEQSRGKKITNLFVEEFANEINGIPKKVDVQNTLFGAETTETPIIIERTELREYASKQIAADKNLFGLVSKTSKVQRLSEEGSAINVDRSKKIAEDAKIASEVLNRFASTKGIVNDILNKYAGELSNAKTAGSRNEIKQNFYRELQSAIPEVISGRVGRGGEGVSKDSGQGSVEPAEVVDDKQQPSVIGKPEPAKAGKAPDNIETLPDGSTVDWNKVETKEKDGLKGTYYATYNKDGSFNKFQTKTEIDRLKALEGKEGISLKQDNYGKQTEITGKATKGKQEGLGLVVEDKNQPSMFKKDEPVKAEAKSDTETKPIESFGEKIGGSRADTADRGYTMTGKTKKEESGPAWRKKYVAMEKVDGSGWTIGKAGDKYGLSARASQKFSTQEEAEAAIPLIAVADSHRVYQSQKEGGYSIFKKVGEKKLFKVVNQDFPSREEATKYMAEHAEEILNIKTTFGEEILPAPETAVRRGDERRTTDATPEMFMETFSPKAIEFGNWNNQEERQQVMNHAYDGLLDLADALNLPPKALMLNGELAIAFGARGQGLSGAKAHYERDYGVINLTKMKGAGSLGHEIFHSWDHYFARQDTKAKSEKKTNARGDLVYPASPVARDDYLSGGESYNSKLRPELQQAFKNLIEGMYKRSEKYVEDTKTADKFLGTARKNLKEQLDQIRNELQRDSTNYHKSKGGYSSKPIKYFMPASTDQVAEFDRLADVLIEGGDLKTEFRQNQAADEKPKKRSRAYLGKLLAGRYSNDTLDGLSTIYKAARGRSGFGSGKIVGALDRVRSAMNTYAERLRLLEDAQSGTEKTKKVSTNYAIEAKKMDQARTSDYWSEPHEVAARAFSAYVEDKIAEKGGQSDFLVYRAHGGIFLPMIDGFIARPYPEGEERIAINNLFDTFIGEIKTKETDKGVMMYGDASPGNEWDQIDNSIKQTWKRRVEDELRRVETENGAAGAPDGTRGERDNEVSYPSGLQLRRIFDENVRGLSEGLERELWKGSVFNPAFGETPEFRVARKHFASFGYTTVPMSRVSFGGAVNPTTKTAFIGEMSGDRFAYFMSHETSHVLSAEGNEAIDKIKANIDTGHPEFFSLKDEFPLPDSFLKEEVAASLVGGWDHYRSLLKGPKEYDDANIKEARTAALGETDQRGDEISEPISVFTISEKGALTRSSRKAYIDIKQRSLFDDEIPNASELRPDNAPAGDNLLHGREISDGGRNVLRGYKPESGTLPEVRSKPIGTWRSSRSRITTLEDAAVIARDNIGSDAQETLVSIVTDKTGKILAINQHTVGGPGESKTYPAILSGQVLNIPEAKSVWMVHNHPGNEAGVTVEDIASRNNLSRLLERSGIEAKPILAVTPKEYSAPGMFGSPIPEKKMATHTFDVQGRKFEQHPEGLTSITQPDELYDFGEKNLPGGGIILVNTKNSPVSIIEVSDYSKLRPDHLDVLKEAERRNASGFMVYDKNKNLTSKDIDNLLAFGNSSQLGLVAVYDETGDRTDEMIGRRGVVGKIAEFYSIKEQDRYIAKERRYAEKRGEDGPFHDAWRVYDTHTDTWGTKIYSSKEGAERAAMYENELLQKSDKGGRANERRRTVGENKDRGRGNVLPEVREEHARQVDAQRQVSARNPQAPRAYQKACEKGQGLTHYPEGYADPEFAELRGLAEREGKTLIPITDTSDSINAVIRGGRIFLNMMREEGGNTLEHIVLHELSHDRGNEATQEKIDTQSQAFKEYRRKLSWYYFGSLFRLLPARHVLEEFAADLESGIDSRYGISLADGLKKGEAVATITAEHTSQIGIEARRARGPPENELYSVKKKEASGSLFPEVNKRLSESKGIKYASLADKTKDTLVTGWEHITRHFPHLDPKTDGTVIDIFRRFQDVPAWSKQETVRRLSDFVGGLSPGDRNVFTMNIILPDMLRDIDSGLLDVGQELPFGYEGRDQVQQDSDNFKALADENPAIKGALDKRNAYMKSLTDQLVEHDLLDKEKAKDPAAYFHHQVLMYKNYKDNPNWGIASKDVRTHTKGWQIGRKGASLDYNTEYVESEFEVISQALTQIETVKTLERIKDVADKKAGLEATAKNQNMQTFQRKTEDSLEDPLAPFKQQIAIGFSRLGKMAKNGTLDVPNFQDVIEHIAEQAEIRAAAKADETEYFPESHPRMFALLNHLVTHGGPGSGPAAMIFKAVVGRNALIKEVVGKDWVTYKDLIPDGYVEHKPEAKSAFYFANTLTDQALSLVQSGRKDLNDVVQRELVRGYDEIWVVKEGISKTLNEFRPAVAESLPARMSEGMLSMWKQWVLMNPFRVIKYNINNMSGDLDIALAYDPKIVWSYFKPALKDLVASSRGKSPGLLLDDLSEMNKLGVIGSGMTNIDIPELSDVESVKGLVEFFDGKSRNALSRWYSMNKKLSTLRENILRLAAYRYFLDKINKGEAVYGASRKTEVDAIEDNKERAAKLARELVGDYGNISHAGQWVRKRLIPFWSWSEINAPRYVRLFKNIPHEGGEPGRYAKTGAAFAWKGTKLAVKAAGLMSLVMMWNAVMFPDEEKDLQKTGREQLHLILGRRKDGTIITIRFQGALSDALAWFGMSNPAEELKQVYDGEKSLEDLGKDVVSGAPLKLFHGLRPEPKLLFEPLIGRSFYPDPLHPRPIRDTTEHILRTFSLDKLYNMAAGKPKKDGSWGSQMLKDIKGMVLYEADPGEQAYYTIRKDVFDWLKKNKEEKPGIEPDDKANAFYYYKQALKYGDFDAAQRYLQKYEELGGKKRNIGRSIKRADPLGSLTARNRRKFKESLTPDQKQTLLIASEWYKKHYVDSYREQRTRK